MTAGRNLKTPQTTTCAPDSSNSDSHETYSSTSENLSSVSSSQVVVRVELDAPDKVVHSTVRPASARKATNNAAEHKPAESATKAPSDRNNKTNDTAQLQMAGYTDDETDHGDRMATSKLTTARVLGDAEATPSPAQLALGGQSKFRRNNNLPSLNYAGHQQEQQVPYDQQILSISLPAAIQLHHQQNFVQQTPAGVYHQPLVSWPCPVTTTTSGQLPLREGPQLYGTPLLYHHPHLTCTTASSYHPHLQPAMMANFGPASISHAPSYLPAPAIYTGQHQHHLYNHHHSNQLLTSPSVAPNQVEAGYNCNHDRASPSSASESSVDSVGETSRVIVDCAVGVVAQGTSQRNKNEIGTQDAELAATKRPPEPTPCDNNNDQSLSDKHNTATLCDDGKAFTRCSNRSPSQQRQQSKPAAAAPDDGGGNLIRCDDNEPMNDICHTTKHRQQSPSNESRPSVIQQEAQIGGEGKDEDETDGRPQPQKRAGVGPLLGAATARASVTARGQTSTIKQTRSGAIKLTDQQQHNHRIRLAPLGESNNQRQLLPSDREPNRRDQDVMVAAGEILTDSLPTIVTSSSNINKSNSCLGDSKDLRQAGELDAGAQSQVSAESQLVGHKVEREHDDQEPTTKTKTKSKLDDEAAKLTAELNPISINGTTFYHPAALLRALPMTTATTINGQGSHQFATGYTYNVGATYQPMGGIAPNLMGYFQPHYQLVNDYFGQPLTAGRVADHHFYFWPNPRQPPPQPHTAAAPFDLVQPTPFALANPRLDYPQLFGHLASELEQRSYLTYHHQLAAGCPRPYDQNLSYLLPSVVDTTQPAFELQPTPIGGPTSQTATALVQQQTSTIQPQPPPAATTTAAIAATTSNSTGVSQLKLGYNLIPLLPINAIPTRVRQAYGMDKVWQDEFEQLFSQFISQVVWTLVEVETNPNIRSSSRILAYKSRYIVRVDNGPVSTTVLDKNLADESASVASTATHEVASPTGSSDATGDEGDDDDEGDANSSWNELEEDEQDCCCDISSAVDAEENQQQTNGVNGNCGRRGPRSGGSNSGESDCDSGAVLNSTSGSSETTSQDLNNPNELAGPNQQNPADSPHCLNSDSANQNESNAYNIGGNVSDCSMQNGRRFPLKFRMFIDSAKVRFCCDSCGHGWTSMKGRVVFWYELFELVDGPSRKDATSEGVSNLIGYCAYKLFGQQCDICKIENRFERPMWYPEEVTKVLCNLFNKIGQVYFGFRMPNIDKQRRAGKPKTSHNSLLCQACHDGVCTDRK